MKPLQANGMPQFGSSMQKKVMNDKQFHFGAIIKFSSSETILICSFFWFVFGVVMFAGYGISLLDISFHCP